MTENGATETSPLLTKSSSVTDYLESGESAVGPLSSETERNEHSKTNGGNEDAEAQEEDNQLFRGLPEVKKQLKYILPAVSIGIFLAAADQTVIASSYGKIGSELQALNNTSWIATSYLLTLTSFQPLYGKLSDIFGRKSCLLVAYAIFGLGGLFCGLARNMNELIIARAFAGIGGGGMSTVVSIMFSDIVPLRERGIWQGFINIVYATGAGVGATLGGALADSIGWRVAFLVQFPLCMIAFIAVAFILKLPKREDIDWKTKLRRVDFPGAFALVAAVTFLLIGLDNGSNVSWSSPLTITFLTVSIPLAGLFMLIEQKYASEPFAPGRIIFERSLAAAYLCNFFAFAGWFGALFNIPLFAQAVNGLSATKAGLRLLPNIITGVTGSVISGYIMKRTGKYYWITVLAYTMLTIGGFITFLFVGTVANSTIGFCVGLALGGLGSGFGVTTSLIALISNAAPEDQAIATACSYLFRSLGSALGLSAFSAITQQVLRVRLQEYFGGGKDAEEIVKRVRESLDFVKTLEPQLQLLVRAAYGEAIRTVFAAIVGVLALSAVSSFFIREKRLSK